MLAASQLHLVLQVIDTLWKAVRDVDPTAQVSRGLGEESTMWPLQHRSEGMATKHFCRWFVGGSGNAVAIAVAEDSILQAVMMVLMQVTTALDSDISQGAYAVSAME